MLESAYNQAMQDVEKFLSFYEADDIVQLNNEAPGILVDVETIGGQRMAEMVEVMSYIMAEFKNAISDGKTENPLKRPSLLTL